MSTPPPIQRLDTDILYYIINMNADMFEDDTALMTTLSTSRVCQAWRTFMISIPSLWAHLIDLDRLYGNPDDWIRELFRRSGSAFLHIKARICAAHAFRDVTIRTKYILDILAENWGQIQKLEAVIVDIEDGDPAKWTPFFLPAPHLESLNLTFSTRRYQFEPMPLSFFSAKSPMLRKFCYMGSLRFDLAAPWLHQLHSIELGITLTAYEVLNVLESTKTLVDLKLDNLVEYKDIIPPLPFVALPKLVHLVLNVFYSFNAVAVLLDHIQIPDTCLLKFIARSMGHHAINVITLGRMIRTLSTYARCYFAKYTPSKISLRYSPEFFVFEDQTHPDSHNIISRIGVDFEDCFPSHVFPMLLSEFSLPEFTKVSEFRFKLLSTSTYNLPVSEFIAFMASLSSIHTLDVDPSALCYLMHVQRAIETADTGTYSVIPFPALKVLKVHPLPGSSSRGASSPISEFILARITHGLPIDILDFSQGTLEVLPYMSFFRDAYGLKVLWRRMWESENVEYICGTGSPLNLLSD
ncbi:hypothetical protein HYPSUDRAFT_38443 [Hypholoma sublateritium FD-334 SS-4]|uniref:F-box domain-containing protein n=1 Tax=Hypholoma sublateritium (strain FD-334 SS-4) TaxID=945553 RepID=A0A0D2LC36_HYPSF|nr:hypothetical protein HYPSUDRAFT_38443 [Hypholoma sublateritium FD-334 SS-4]